MDNQQAFDEACRQRDVFLEAHFPDGSEMQQELYRRSVERKMGSYRIGPVVALKTTLEQDKLLDMANLLQVIAEKTFDKLYPNVDRNIDDNWFEVNRHCEAYRGFFEKNLPGDTAVYAEFRRRLYIIYNGKEPTRTEKLVTSELQEQYLQQAMSLRDELEKAGVT